MADDDIERALAEQARLPAVETALARLGTNPDDQPLDVELRAAVREPSKLTGGER